MAQWCSSWPLVLVVAFLIYDLATSQHLTRKRLETGHLSHRHQHTPSFLEPFPSNDDPSLWYRDKPPEYDNSRLNSPYYTQSHYLFEDHDVKTAPLTSARNKSSQDVFSNKWGSEKKPTGPKSNSIESSLAAIFRGVAYGVSSTSTITTSTSSEPVTPATHVSDVNKHSIQKATKQNESFHDRNVKDGYSEHRNNENAKRTPKLHENKSTLFTLPPSTGIPKISNTEVKRAGLEKWQTRLEGAWEVHVYCSAASFSLLALLCFLCIVRVNLSTYLLPSRYYITAHLLVFLASLCRCFLFFLDPYASNKILPVTLSDILFNSGVPCVTAAFSVVVLAFLNCARIILLPLNLQTPLVFGIISSVYIASSVLVDILAGIFPRQEWSGALRASVQALTAGWTAAMCLGYMIIFYRIEKSALRQREDLVRDTYSRENAESMLPRKLPTFSLNRGARLILVASFCGLAIAVLQVYGLMTPDGLLQLPPGEPWIWFSYQTCCRLLEIIMWSCVCVAAALSSNSTLNKDIRDEHGLRGFSCKICTSCSSLSCHESCGKKENEDMYSDVCQTNLAARSFTIDVNGKIRAEDGRTLPTIPSTLRTKDRDLNKKCATLHSANSDIHLLWGVRNSNSSTSRPASMIFNENGLVRFKTDMDGAEISDDLKNNYTTIDAPASYADHFYNTHSRSREYSIKDPTLHATADSDQLQTLLHSKLSTERQDNIVGVKRNRSGPNNEYSYTEIGQNQHNDTFVRYPTSCSAVNATNNYDARIYDDYEVASYYHSPVDGGRASAASHVYASLQPNSNNSTPNKYARNPRFTSNSCFSSPMSAGSSNRSNHSPRFTNLHNSDSDLCSSITDRTLASSSQGNDEVSEKCDSENFTRHELRRHLSHPENIPDEINNAQTSNIQTNRINNDSEMIYRPNQYSPVDSDDIYTPLMDHNDYKRHDSPLHVSQQCAYNRNKTNHYNTKIQNNQPGTAMNTNQRGNFERRQGSSHSLSKSTPTSPGCGPNGENMNIYHSNYENVTNIMNLGKAGPPMASEDYRPRMNILHGDEENVLDASKPGSGSNASNSAVSEELKSGFPQQPDPTETWIVHSRDGLKTEYVKKGASKDSGKFLSSTKRPSVAKV